MRSTCAATALLASLTATACSGSSSSGQPDATEPSCDADACIERDAYGTPLIYAQTMPAAAYALGYAQAEDHASAIVTFHLRAEGRLAEYGGDPDHASANKPDVLVQADLLTHALHVPDVSAALYPALPEEIRAQAESYAAGVNRYLDEHPGEPALDWFAGFRLTGETVFARERFDVVMKQYQAAQDEIDSFEPDPENYQHKKCPGYVNADASAQSQSNSWAVSAPLAPKGVTMLAGDPHLPWDLDPLDGAADGFFHYEAHFEVAGRRFGGAIPLGTPRIGPGYTDDAAWTGTHSAVDIADAYHLEVVDPVALSYRVGTEIRTAELRQVTIEVKDQSPVTFTLADSVFGPILCQKGSGKDALVVECTAGFDHAFGLLLPSLDAAGPLEPGYRLLEAQSLDDLVAALGDQQAPEINLMLATRSGHIVFNLAARVPVRNPDPSICYRWPLESGNPATLPTWDEAGGLVIVPFDDHPLLVDPPSGYLVNNNAPPQFCTAGLSGADLPWHNGLYQHDAEFDPNNGGQRQRLAREVFDTAEAGSIDTAASTALSTNTEVLAWRFFKPLLEQLRTERPAVAANPVYAAAIDELLAWDGHVGAESRAVLVFVGWAARLAELGHHPFNRTDWLANPDAALLDDAEQALVGPDGVLPYLAGDGLATVADRDGALVPWGSVHYLELFAGDTRRPLGSGDRFLQTLLMSNASRSYPDWGMGKTDGGSSFLMQVTYAPDGMQVHVVKPIGVLTDHSDTRFGAMSDQYASGKHRAVSLPGPGPDALRLTLP